MPPDQPDQPPPEGEDGPRGRDADRRGRESPDPPHAGGDADAGSPGEAELPGPEEDLSAILGRWRVGRRHATVRMIRTAAGARAIQVRLPLGILQMGLGGRPDGRRPHGADSLLDWHLGRLEAHRAEGGDDGSFVLSSRECSSLRDEGVQVYHRYVALFALEEHELVVRDAERNLRMFDLCRDHGASHADRNVLEQYRPFVVMMRARAQAAIALATADARGALAAVDAALAEMRLHFDAHGPHDGFDRSNEANLLRGMRDALVPPLRSTYTVTSSSPRRSTAWTLSPGWWVRRSATRSSREFISFLFHLSRRSPFLMPAGSALPPGVISMTSRPGESPGSLLRRPSRTVRGRGRIGPDSELKANRSGRRAMSRAMSWKSRTAFAPLSELILSTVSRGVW